MPRIELTAYDVCADFAASLWDVYTILEWRKAITLPALDRFSRFSDKLRKMRPDAPIKEPLHGLLVVVPMVAATPEPAVREAMANSMKRYGDATRSIALVYDAQGLQATVVRSIASAVTLVARNTAPTRVFSTLKEATAWQTAHHNMADRGPDLCEAAEQTRRLGVG